MKTKVLRRKIRFWTGFAAGLAAGAVASGAMLLISVTLGGISLPEVFGSELTALMPPPLFAYLHSIIGGDAKFLWKPNGLTVSGPKNPSLCH